MSRTTVHRSIDPLVTILWTAFLISSAWTAAVWTIGINATWLGFSAMDGANPPSNAELRRAILLLAEHADLAWLALAAVNLHLMIASMHGLRTARAWFGVAVGGAFIFGAASNLRGIPFGWMTHYQALGLRILGVSIGWLLLWTVVILAARESTLRILPRASHRTTAVAGAALALVTFGNLATSAAVHRAWWGWHTGNISSPAPMPSLAWLAWFLCPMALLLMLREKNIAAAAARRPLRPVIILALLNAMGAALHVRTLLD